MQIFSAKHKKSHFPLEKSQSGHGKNGQNEFWIGHLITTINFIYSRYFDTPENTNDK